MENPHNNCRSLRCQYFKFQTDEKNTNLQIRSGLNFLNYLEKSKQSSFCSVLEVSYRLQLYFHLTKVESYPLIPSGNKMVTHT